MAQWFICLMVVAIFFQFGSSIPDKGRFRRHADGLFTSELSKMKNDFAMRSYLKTLLISKRGVMDLDFVHDSEENKARSEEACFNWVHQSFLSENLSENDALKTAHAYYKIICRPLGHFIGSLNEHIPVARLLEIKE